MHKTDDPYANPPLTPIFIKSYRNINYLKQYKYIKKIPNMG